MEFEIKKCKKNAAYKVIPKKKVKLNLEKIKKSFEVMIDTPIALVIKRDDEIIVKEYGELMFKTLTDIDKIRKIADEIYEVGA